MSRTGIEPSPPTRRVAPRRIEKFALWRAITEVLKARGVANTAAITRKRTRGSIYSVGRDFQPFRINDLELVAQICPRWNRTTDWLKGLDEFRIAA